MLRRFIWADPVTESMGTVPMSGLHEWFKTARRDLVVRIGDETHDVATWLNFPDRLLAVGGGPSLLQRTFEKSISLREILEGGWRSGGSIVKFGYYMSPAVITEGTVHVVQITTIRPLKRLKGWRLRRRAVSAAATAPPRLVEAPLFVDSEVVEPPKVIAL